MKIESIKWSLMCAFVVSVHVAAAAEPGKTIKLRRTHVETVDGTNMTFTVKMDQTNMVVRFTPQTRFFLNGKPAVSKDLEAADHVTATLKAADGRVEAVRVEIVKLAPK